jgi:hypothetical protein
MGEVISVLTNPADPFEDDRNRQYEAERRMKAEQCARDLKRGIWTAVTGAPKQGTIQTVDALNSPNCQPGPWLPPSQRPPAPAPQPPAPSDPGLRLREPGPLRWGGAPPSNAA